jgi:ACS family 4-hydroxyphenylacetate permease-like MFS transporter
MGIPATIAIASTLSGFILQMDGFLGLAGWQWLFLLEGLPAVVFGIVCLFYLDDSPARAKWLRDEEKEEIAERLEQDRALEETQHSRRSVLGQLGSLNVVLLCAAYFGLVTSLNANSTWVPQIVHGLAPGASYAIIGLLTALPAIITVVVMPSWGASSDRRNERLWHLRIALLVAATGWLLVIGSDLATARYFGLILTSAGSFCALLVFWTIPVALLSPAARPAGIAFINTIGIGGGSALSPLVIGYFKDLTGSFTSGLLYVIAMLIMSMICITVVATQKRPVAPVPSPSRA